MNSFAFMFSSKFQSVVRATPQLFIPQLLNSGILAEKLHAVVPRLPHLRMNETLPEIKKFLRAQVEIGKQAIDLVVCQKHVGWLPINSIQFFVQGVIPFVERLKEFLGQSYRFKLLFLDALCEGHDTSLDRHQGWPR